MAPAEQLVNLRQGHWYEGFRAREVKVEVF